MTSGSWRDTCTVTVVVLATSSNHWKNQFKVRGSGFYNALQVLQVQLNNSSDIKFGIWECLSANKFLHNGPGWKNKKKNMNKKKDYQVKSGSLITYQWRWDCYSAFQLIQTSYLLECQMLYHTGLVGTLVVVLVPDSLPKGEAGVCTLQKLKLLF